MTILTIPNVISFVRIPLALLFLQSNPFYRTLAIVGALLTDGLDGFLARRFHQKSRFGTVLDPISDKFFVFFVLNVLIAEGRLSILEACFLICRDFSVILYGGYLAWKSRLFDYQFRAIWCGKITTALQFTVLMCLTLNISIPPYLYGIFAILGILALGELYHTDKKRKAFTQPANFPSKNPH